MIEKQTYFGVYGVIANEGRVLCVRKTRGPYIGKYDLPGGGIQHGETLLQSLRREVQEEVGIVDFTPIFVRDFSFVTPYKRDGQEILFHHIAFLYQLTRADITEHNPFIYEEDVNGSEWVEINSLDENNTSPLLYEVHK